VNGPIFIGGAGRSGKTLLRWMLSAHPGIVVSRRTDMWPRFAGRFGDLASPDHAQACVDAMMRRPQIAALGTDVVQLLREFERGAPTYARLFALVHEQYAQRSGKRRWGDQTGLIECYAAEIVDAYDDARVVHLVRDPRDRYAALVERGNQRACPLLRATNNWMLSARLAEVHARRYPDAYLVVRYETLVTQPDTTLRSICAFLGEDFDPAMLRLDGAPRYDGERARTADGSAVTTAYVGQYRGVLEARDVAFIEQVAHRHLVRFGYEPEEQRLARTDRARVVATGGLARFALPRSNEAVAE
jgi:sulfotransferase family protein